MSDTILSLQESPDDAGFVECRLRLGNDGSIRFIDADEGLELRSDPAVFWSTVFHFVVILLQAGVARLQGQAPFPLEPNSAGLFLQQPAVPYVADGATDSEICFAIAFGLESGLLCAWWTGRDWMVVLPERSWLLFLSMWPEKPRWPQSGPIQAE